MSNDHQRSTRTQHNLYVRHGILGLHRLITLVLCWAAFACGASHPQLPGHTALLLSDLHLVPFPEPRHPDTHMALWQSTQTALQDLARQYKPDMMIIGGDCLAHQFKRIHDAHASGDYPNAVRQIMRSIARDVHHALPNTPVYVVLGNNDTDQQDYDIAPHSDFLHHMATVWSPLVPEGAARQAFSDTFPEQGCYTVPLSHTTQLVALNTVAWSTHAPEHAADTAQHVLTWLDRTLRRATMQGQHVWLAFHIPMGVDLYASLAQPTARVTGFWQPQYEQAFHAVLARYPHTVAALFVGHNHMNGAQSIRVGQTRVPVISMPSISPIFGNHPSIKVIAFNPRTLAIRDEWLHVHPGSDTTAWPLAYPFNAQYQPHCPSCPLITGIQALAQSPTLPSGYPEHYGVGHATRFVQDPQHWPWHRCHMQHGASTLDFTACVTSQGV